MYLTKYTKTSLIIIRLGGNGSAGKIQLSQFVPPVQSRNEVWIHLWDPHALIFTWRPTVLHFPPSPLASAGFPFDPSNSTVSDLPSTLPLPNSHVFLPHSELGLHTASSRSPYSGLSLSSFLAAPHPLNWQSPEMSFLCKASLTPPPHSIPNYTISWEFLFLLTQKSQVPFPVINIIMKSPFPMKLLGIKEQCLLL